MSKIKEFVFNKCKLEHLNEGTAKLINTLIEQFQSKVSSEQLDQQLQTFESQFLILFKTLNTPDRISVLNDENHRTLIIEFIKRMGIEHYKFSYYNRAKLTKIHIKHIEHIGPILFSEAVMIASKINLINKNNSRFFTQDHLYTNIESPIDMRIQQILKLCDQKKRNVNNNFKKLQLILESPDYVEIIKELGKMLRDSWKKDKSKVKCFQTVKQLVKQTPKQIYININDNSLHLQINEHENQRHEGQFDGLSFTSSLELELRREHSKKSNLKSVDIIDFDELSLSQLQLPSAQKYLDFI